MANNRAFKVGQPIMYGGESVVILKVFNGGTNNKICYHNGIVPVGVHHKPCTYLLSSGQRVKGKTLKTKNSIILKTN